MNAIDNKLLDQIMGACSNGPISYRDYIDIVLYADEFGYYKRDRQRVGHNQTTDFYTAESLGPVFAQLVTTAAEDLLGKSIAANSTFIEIAAEPGTELLSHLEKHPFTDSRVIRHGKPIRAGMGATTDDCANTTAHFRASARRSHQPWRSSNSDGLWLAWIGQSIVRPINGGPGSIDRRIRHGPR